MEKDKVAAQTAFDELSLKKKISHIWYYYKFRIIISLAILLSSISIIYGCVTRVHPDLTVIFLSRSFVGDEMLSSLEEWILPQIQDANNDGRMVVTIVPMLFDPENPTETTTAFMQSFEAQLFVGDVKLFIADEFFMTGLNAREDNLIERYAEITNYPTEFSGLLSPLFVAERIEYLRHMTGRHAERKQIEHANARAVFEWLSVE